MKKCPQCHHENPDTEEFCINCGMDLSAAPAPAPAPPQPAPPSPQPSPPGPEPERKCKACGSPLPPGARFCNQCGHPVAEEEREEAPKPPPPPPPKGPKLILLQAKDSQKFPLTGPCEVGREGDIAVPGDAKMSRKHAILTESGGQWFIEDNRSTNGTFVEIRGKYALKEGDRIQLGDTVFEFRTQ